MSPSSLHLFQSPQLWFESDEMAMGSHRTIQAGVDVTCWNACPSFSSARVFHVGSFSRPPLPLINFGRGSLSFFSLAQCPSNLFFPRGPSPWHNLVPGCQQASLCLWLMCSFPVPHVLAIQMCLCYVSHFLSRPADAWQNFADRTQNKWQFWGTWCLRLAVGMKEVSEFFGVQRKKSKGQIFSYTWSGFWTFFFIKFRPV